MTYRMFVSEEGDWYVVAKNEKNRIEVLYEGYNKALAFEKILLDFGVKIHVEERNMENADTYEPTLDDFLES